MADITDQPHRLMSTAPQPARPRDRDVVVVCGPFVEIENISPTGGTCLRLDFDDLPTLAQAVDMLRAAGEPAKETK